MVDGKVQKKERDEPRNRLIGEIWINLWKKYEPVHDKIN